MRNRIFLFFFDKYGKLHDFYNNIMLFLFCFQSRRRAEKLGRLCLFYETPAAASEEEKEEEDSAETSLRSPRPGRRPPPPVHVHLRSAQRPDWYLGFNRKRKRMTYTPQ